MVQREVGRGIGQIVALLDGLDAVASTFVLRPASALDFTSGEPFRVRT